MQPPGSVLLTGTGLWYSHGVATEIRWVYVRDRQGTHRDDCIFSTDVSLSPKRIVGLFTRRWAIEVAFEADELARLTGVSPAQDRKGSLGTVLLVVVPANGSRKRYLQKRR